MFEGATCSKAGDGVVGGIDWGEI